MQTNSHYIQHHWKQTLPAIQNSQKPWKTIKATKNKVIFYSHDITTTYRSLTNITKEHKYGKLRGHFSYWEHLHNYTGTIYIQYNNKQDDCWLVSVLWYFQHK